MMRRSGFRTGLHRLRQKLAKKYGIPLVLGVIAFLVSAVWSLAEVPPSAPTTDPTLQLIGRWFGIASEKSIMTGKLKGYTVELRLDQLILRQQAGGTAYQSSQCAATLRYIGVAGGYHYFFEKRTAESQCPSGNVRIRLREDGKLEWQWYHRDINAPIATAVLERMEIPHEVASGAR